MAPYPPPPRLLLQLRAQLAAAGPTLEALADGRPRHIHKVAHLQQKRQSQHSCKNRVKPAEFSFLASRGPPWHGRYMPGSATTPGKATQLPACHWASWLPRPRPTSRRAVTLRMGP